MPELKIHQNGIVKVLFFEGAPLLAPLLREHGYAVSTPCGSAGVCGRCSVRAAGSLEPAAVNGRVLACKTRLAGSAEVWLDSPTELNNIAMAGALPLMELKPHPGDYGMAVDIGTTTLAAMLLDLRTGKPLAAAGAANPQASMSDNVIGRISASLQGEGPRLQDLIRGALRQLEREVIKKAGVKPAAVTPTVIAGNTAMLYFHEGLSPKALSAAPFLADRLFGEWTNENTYLPRCMGAFLGADLTLAIVASGMCGRGETALLADIGTNGEIALWHNGNLYCAAAAAGPAFEGGGISQGLGSVNGAIDSVKVVGGKLEVTTIGKSPAKGICGSGLVDAAAALLETGLMDETGRLEQPEAELAPGVALRQKDIRQLQLAKGAIAAAIGALCQSAGIGNKDIKRFYLAGGFGTYMRADSAARIGLIPQELLDRTVALGNAALTGAAMLLLNSDLQEESTRIARQAGVITLSGSALFSQLFAERMMFERF